MKAIPFTAVPLSQGKGEPKFDLQIVASPPKAASARFLGCTKLILRASDPEGDLGLL